MEPTCGGQHDGEEDGDAGGVEVLIGQARCSGVR